jgi:DNA-binding HxlR family transcriptional regulator
MATLAGGETFCGVAAAVAILGDAWTLLIVRDLAGGPRRFGELQRSTGISARVLTDRLRAMNAAGLVIRRMYVEIPPRVEYELTEKGRDAIAIVDALRTYGASLRVLMNNLSALTHAHQYGILGHVIMRSDVLIDLARGEL